MPDKTLLNWRVRSDLPLPDLLDWEGDDRAPDVEFRLTRNLHDGSGWRRFSPAVWIGPDNQVRLSIPAVATYLVEGMRVSVDPVLPAEAPDVRAFLLGSVLAVLCFNRAVLPLHASAVQMGSGAVVLSGNSGAGKSTLAAALNQRGAGLLSDDLCALDFLGRDQPLILPAFPRLKLWSDSAGRLDLATDGLERTRAELQKFHFPPSAGSFRSAPLPLDLVVLLSRRGGPGPMEPKPLKGLAVMQQRQVVHRWRLGEALGHDSLIFNGLAALARSARVVELGHGGNLAALPDLAAAVEALTLAERLP